MFNKTGKFFLLFMSLSLIFFIASSTIFIASCTRNPSVTAKQAGKDDSVNEIDLNGKQLIEVVAKSGGYYPKSIDAKASVPSMLRIKSENAYSCERAFVIPQIRVSAILPINGITDIEIGTFDAGTRLIGTCSMGMYSFVINFN
ncbi:MAG: hypothetical protein FJW61_06785 [Actinobacteria bacterium]|nr:hypothetical protein [Actinomycetota bacterium]